MSVSDFLPPGRLVELVTEVVSSVRRAEERSATDSDRNTIDPFSAIFDAALKGVSADEWMTLELARQNQKSLQNAIGTFHQRLLGSVDGWEDQAAGGSVDLRNDARTVIAEVKNKYNTMNSSSSEARESSSRRRPIRRPKGRRQLQSAGPGWSAAPWSARRRR